MAGERESAKARRRLEILDAAARLFAVHGYAQVTLDAIGEQVGISGPGVYRHFGTKNGILAALLLGVSEELLNGAERICGRSGPAAERADALILFHVGFALRNADIIKIHERDYSSLEDPARSEVRSTQRAYVRHWGALLGELERELGGKSESRTPGEASSTDPERERWQAFAVLGLINSTAYSLARRGQGPEDEASARAGELLHRMARGAVGLGSAQARSGSIQPSAVGPVDLHPDAPSIHENESGALPPRTHASNITAKGQA